MSKKKLIEEGPLSAIEEGHLSVIEEGPLSVIEEGPLNVIVEGPLSVLVEGPKMNFRLFFSILYLKNKFIINRDNDEEINAKRITLKKKEKFLDIISMKGSLGYCEFCNAIQQGRNHAPFARNVRQKPI